MDFLTELWLPILLSAVFVFVVSSVLHMVIPIHKNDYSKFPSEEKVLEGLRAAGVTPGDYAFPCPTSMKEMGSPEMLEKYKQGPVGFVTVLPNGPPAMGKSLVQWFIYSIVISIFCAYVASWLLNPASGGADVFRLTGTVAVLGYAVGHIPNSIWKGEAWSTSLKFIFDGILYGVATGAAFMWFWPEPSAPTIPGM